MKITIYTITDCQFSKQEKEYLASHGLPFDEKNLETNKEWLTEMLTVSNNFAGTPVTKLDKDDGTSIVLKGFTKDEFDLALGYVAPAATPQPVAGAMPPAPEPTAPQPVTPPISVAPAPIPVPVAPPTVIPPAPQPIAPQAVTPPVSFVPPPMPPAPTFNPAPVQPPAPMPTPVAPPVAAGPDPLDAILNDLQSKVSNMQAPAPAPIGIAPQPPAPQSVQPGGFNIPEPDFKS